MNSRIFRSFGALLTCALLASASAAPPRVLAQASPAPAAPIEQPRAAPPVEASAAAAQPASEPAALSVAELTAEVAKLNASLQRIMEAQRRAQAHLVWRADKARQLHDLSPLRPVGLVLLGAGILVPSVYYAAKDSDAIVPMTVVGLMGFLPLIAGAVLLKRSGPKRRALRREIREADAKFLVAPMLSATRAGVTLQFPLQ